MKESIKKAISELEELSRKKRFRVVSHYDADGITSAGIFTFTLRKWGKEFSIQIVKGLEEDFIKSLPENEVIIFLDLASGSLNYLKEKNTEVFIFDHHEIVQDIPDNVRMINPLLYGEMQLSSSAIVYLFAKELSLNNRDLATLALIGMVGDMQEKEISKILAEIIYDAEGAVKRGLLLYPSTRPLNKALEYCSSPFIPGVSGSREGVTELLRDAGLSTENGKYKALYELDAQEMQNLVTAILMKCGGNCKAENLIGNLILVKFFNRLEDARELSALINACGRMDYPEVALGFCLGNKRFRMESERIYIDYKQSIIAALKYFEESEKFMGEGYMIINAKDRIRDTIIGTVTSIVSHSSSYPEGLIVIALAYNEDKVKVSARIVGRKGRNVREVLSKAVFFVGGEVGGHPNAAGCLISKDKEEAFVKELRKVLESEIISEPTTFSGDNYTETNKFVG